MHRLIADIITAQQDYLFKVAFMRVKSRQQAQDIIQEAFLRLWERGALLDSNQNIKLYLYRIVINLCNDWTKANQLITHDVSAIESVDLSQEDLPLKRECERVQSLLAFLPSAQREVIQMHVHDDLSFAEISRITNIAQSTLKSRFKAGINALRNHLKQSDDE